jgi:hypothetical protein
MRTLSNHAGRTLWAAVIAAAVLWAPAASADVENICMQTNYTNHGLSQTLNCTANDVRVARVTNIDITSGGECHPDPTTGTKVCTCVAGGNVTFTADYEVRLTAQTRYDIGVYFAVDGDPNNDGAYTGACKLIDLDMTNAPSTFIQLDSSEGNECGDIDAANNPQIIHAPLTVACEAGAGNKLKLPNCTSWRQPGANDYCAGALDVFPGSPSKCHCDQGFTIDIIVEHPVPTIEKVAAPTALDEPGGLVTYTVTVGNPGQYASITLTSLVDDPDNNPGTANSVTYAPIGSYCSPTTIPPGGTSTCTFSHAVTGNAGDTITDKACVTGTDSNGASIGTLCDTASVSIRDVLPTAVVTKTVDKATCAQVKYNVKVENTDTAEALTLSALVDDPFGNIAAPAALGANVKSTTCVVPQTIAASDKYECSFEALVCSFPATDTVTGTLSDNDRNTITPSGQATVNGVTLQRP